jgi:lipoic acid synthetase
MINRLPSWLRQDIPDAKTLKLSHLLSGFGVNTVCKQARCPNINYCFKNNQAAFMILGAICTRNCKFCAVSKLKNEHLGIDDDEPYRISEVVKLLGLNYVVITSVTRDDLSDSGASQFAKTVELIRAENKDIKIELLIPDFQGKIPSLQAVLDASPDCLAHNIEMVERLYSELRPMADYRLSLRVLKKAKELNPGIVTKSSIMLGMGETKKEVTITIKDLKNNYCDILTLGQYLAPSVNHYPVQEFIDIEQFKEYRDIALEMGFRSVLSGPLARSSYRADGAYEDVLV